MHITTHDDDLAECAECLAEAQALFDEIKEMGDRMRAERLALIDIVTEHADVATLAAIAEFLAKPTYWKHGRVQGHA